MNFEALLDSSLPAISVGLNWLGTYLIHGTLLLGAGLLFSKRIRSIWLRERFLRVALFGGLVTATVQTGMGFEPWFGTISLEAGTTSPVLGQQNIPGTGDTLIFQDGFESGDTTVWSVSTP